MCTQTTFHTRGTRLNQQARRHHLLPLKVVMPVKRSNKKIPIFGYVLFFFCIEKLKYFCTRKIFSIITIIKIVKCRKKNNERKRFYRLETPFSRDAC